MKTRNVYHIDRNGFKLNGVDYSDEFFGSECPQNYAKDLVLLKARFVELGWMSRYDEIVIDNLDNCLECDAEIDGGVYCDLCAEKHAVVEMHKLNGCF